LEGRGGGRQGSIMSSNSSTVHIMKGTSE
jgi:hypothetical protein